MKKLLSVLAALLLALPSVGIGASAESGADERTVYQSSENYAISSDGTWDGGIWSAQVYDLEKNAYSRMTDASSGAKWGVNYGTDDGDYYRLAVTNPDNYQRIGAYWMTPAARTKADGSHKNPAVKTFTAPKSGTVTIACGDNKFGPKDGMQSNTRIRLESGDGTLSTVWPSDAEYFTMPKDSTANVPYDPFSISLKQGEKLHFEVSRNVEKLDTDSVWARIYWDPVVTYQSIDPDTPDEPDDQIRYQASEAFRAASNSDRHWRWQYYSISEHTYYDLKNTFEMSGFAEDGQSAGTAWTDLKNNRAIAVGKYKMRPGITPDVASEEEKSGKIIRDHAVRTFTAAKRGVAVISAGGGGITAGGGGVVRITRQNSGEAGSTLLWPGEDDGEWVSPLKSAGGSLAFDEITVSLNPGDSLRFESTYQYMSGGASPWQSAVEWDPIVEYQAVYPVLKSCAPAVGASDVPLNTEHALTFDGDLYPLDTSNVRVYEFDEEGKESLSDAVCTGLTMADERSLRLSYSGLKPYTSYLVRIEGICYSAMPLDNQVTEELTFTTGPTINIGEILAEDGVLKQGINTIGADINNSGLDGIQAVLLAAVCKGTPERYTVVTVRYAQRDNIGANERLTVDVELPNVKDYFIKAVLLEDVRSARPYSHVQILKGGE